jgi:flagellar protein FlaG
MNLAVTFRGTKVGLAGSLNRAKTKVKNIMSENDLKLVSSVPSNLANGQPTAKAVPDRVAPTIAPEKLKSQADSTKAATMNQLNQNHQDFKKAVIEINKALEKIPTSLAFQVDEASNRFIVNVADISTGELIRQIPGEAVLRIARQLESLKGIIFDDKY